MKYVGAYWTVFAPLMKKSIKKRFNKEMAGQAIRHGKDEYRRLLSHADDLGPGNPMAQNAYFAYVFAAAWLGSEKRITPDEMAFVMTDVLESRLLRTIFGMMDLNKTPKKYGKDYPVNWVVRFDETLHQEGSYYCFTRCPICEFCQREGISELMPALCSTDEVMFRLQHGKLHREHTIANGDDVCDYWIVGDQVKI